MSRFQWIIHRLLGWKIEKKYPSRTIYRRVRDGSRVAVENPSGLCHDLPLTGNERRKTGLTETLERKAGETTMRNLGFDHPCQCCGETEGYVDPDAALCDICVVTTKLMRDEIQPDN